jgi:hypothetical protein
MKKRLIRQTNKLSGDLGVPVDSPSAPVEYSEAGDGADIHKSYVESMIRTYRAQANQHFTAARRLIGHDRDNAEKEARKAIDSIVHAFWWAENSKAEEAQHQLMHRIGRWTRKNFNCQLRFDEEKYYRSCPIDISHTRVGMSIGFIANRICSLCGEDLSECAHLLGRAYWVHGGPDATGQCPVCNKESCRHSPDRLYRAQVISIVKSGTIREVSLVRRPANPEARLLRIQVTRKDLAEEFGPSFVYGMTVSCNKCLGECPGFSDFGPELEDSERNAPEENPSVGC